MRREQYYGRGQTENDGKNDENDEANCYDAYSHGPFQKRSRRSGLLAYGTKCYSSAALIKSRRYAIYLLSVRRKRARASSRLGAIKRDVFGCPEGEPKMQSILASRIASRTVQ